jgi:hypothetical protein
MVWIQMDHARFSPYCAFRRSWAVIPLIVGTPEKRTFWSPSFYAQVVTMGQVLVFREQFGLIQPPLDKDTAELWGDGTRAPL